MQNQRLLVQFWAPDDGRCFARNMLSFIQIWNKNFDTLLHLVGFSMWIILWCSDPRTSSWEPYSQTRFSYTIFFLINIFGTTSFFMRSIVTNFELLRCFHRFFVVLDLPDFRSSCVISRLPKTCFVQFKYASTRQYFFTIKTLTAPYNVGCSFSDLAKNHMLIRCSDSMSYLFWLVRYNTSYTNGRNTDTIDPILTRTDYAKKCWVCHNLA
jgi:hypothetical protein